MDLMKELLEERKQPHYQDIQSWRQIAEEAAKDLAKACDNVRGEDVDSDYYKKSRELKVVKYLKNLIDRLDSETAKLKKMS